jgi:hypothetical protein
MRTESLIGQNQFARIARYFCKRAFVDKLQKSPKMWALQQHKLKGEEEQ